MRARCGACVFRLDAGTGLVAVFLYVSENWRCFRISKQGHQINEEIRDRELRVIDENGEMLGIMSRDQVYLEPDPTATPIPKEEPDPTQTDTQTGEYFFPDSDSRYLTDEEVAVYSSDQLELAKNEIYARHGRQFVTQYISDYFNSKSWYQGTIDPDTFDAQQDSIFNEYEMANISKIAEWEERKSGEGN